MREIKFRAWDTIRKKMWSPEEMGQDELTLNPDGRGFVNVSGDSTRKSQYLSYLVPLQLTGLKDKKGTEIYEGDILRFHRLIFFSRKEEVYEDTIAKVVWGYGGFTLEAIGENKLRTLMMESGEIIGNIYENSSLLDKGSNA